VKNLSDLVLPFFLGGHPGFNCPVNQGETYQDYYIEFEQEETCTVPTPVTETGLINMEYRSQLMENEDKIWLKHKLFHNDAIILDELKSRSIKLISVNSGKGIRMDFADFPYLILWSSSNDGPFVAIEPWTGLSTCSDESDIFEEKRNVQLVESHRSKQYAYSITLI
jgi:galactose mutarotase-like enzyme